ELARAERAAVYARIGTCTQEFGTLASWLVDVINVLTGHLDQVGGAMFTRAATGSPHTRGTPGRGKGVRFGRRRSRVREAPEVYGELPVACLAEELEAPGEGQIRALVTVAGNPVLSTPNGARLDRALASLEFMVSLDIYVNETTRHADVILPGLSPLEQSHYDVILRQLAIRNVATYSPPTFDPPAGHPSEWQTVLRLAAIVAGQGEGADIAALDDFVVMQRVALERSDGEMVLIGRRDLRSNNSWMHNLRVLVKGNPRCTAQLHPADAARLGIASGELARVTSRVGAIELPVEVTDAIMPGVM